MYMISKTVVLTSSRTSTLDSRRNAAEPDRKDSVSSGSRPIDYSKVRRDLARAVARICPGWLFDQRDDLVQMAMMRVMQSVRKTTPECEEIRPSRRLTSTRSPICSRRQAAGSA